MSRVSLVLLVAIAVLFSTATSQQCPPNEEWTTCGSACPPSCTAPQPQACTLQCVIGCQCKSGYLKNSAGNCVHPGQC